MSRDIFFQVKILIVCLILVGYEKILWCESRLTFPSEPSGRLRFSNGSLLFHNQLINNNLNSNSNGVSGMEDDDKWSWKGWNGQVVHTVMAGHHKDKGWQWMESSSERMMRFPLTQSNEVVADTSGLFQSPNDLPKWPRTSKSLFNQHTLHQLHNQQQQQQQQQNQEQPNPYQIPQYASKFLHSNNNNTPIVHLSRPSNIKSRFQLPEKLQNYYVKKFGNMPSGSSSTETQAMPDDWQPGPIDNEIYPKHLYYGHPREIDRKRFSLEIHPAYIVGPLAGLATFGLVSKLIKTPVLLELGLVDKDKDYSSNGGSSNLLHHHQHQHAHYHKQPGGGGAASSSPPGIIGLWPVPIQAGSSISSSVASSASASAGGVPSSGTEFPIILGTTQFRPTSPVVTGESAGGDNTKPWWSPFTAMIPRLRFNDPDNLERE